MCHYSKITVGESTFEVHECGGVTVTQIAPAKGVSLHGEWDRTRKTLRLPSATPEVKEAVRRNLVESGR